MCASSLKADIAQRPHQCRLSAISGSRQATRIGGISAQGVWTLDLHQIVTRPSNSFVSPDVFGAYHRDHEQIVREVR
jgi:hypothetical protein